MDLSLSLMLSTPDRVAEDTASMALGTKTFTESSKSLSVSLKELIEVAICFL